ncbi:DUF481 domain-containing protein [Pelagicoccus mobilis]|uniref:DUF481 domain-containing protein n=1 Tax=Pelagicoccus mobilis TaxID=415221 RepID=A0A934S2F9_9BACT|nr:DUF481 domain-containing protein [Pelagicoccus mobilis]MBK1877833.1 DUF481 domain-containing protein [Pelagicoccus mobilis]
MSKFFVSIFLIHLSLALAWAEGEEIQVILDNGDRLTGELISQNESEIRMRVGYLGEVTLPRARVETLERLGGVVAKNDAEPKPEASPNIKEGEDEKKAVVAEGGAQKTEKQAPAKPAPQKVAPEKVLAAKGKQAVEKGEPKKGEAAEQAPEEKKRKGVAGWLAKLEDGLDVMPKWKKNMQFGYNSASGRKDFSTLNYRLDMSRKYEKSRLNFNADYAYGDSDGSTNLDKYSVKFRWRKDISPGAFYESQSIYSADQIKSIFSNFEQKLGLGTRFLDSKTTVLSAGLGASGRWRELKKGRDSDSLVSVFQDWDYKLSEKVRLKQDFKFAMPLDDTEEYEIDFAASLRTDVTDAINLSLRFQFGYDNSLPEDSKEDRRLISALGYKF